MSPRGRRPRAGTAGAVEPGAHVVRPPPEHRVPHGLEHELEEEGARDPLRRDAKVDVEHEVHERPVKPVAPHMSWNGTQSVAQFLGERGTRSPLGCLSVGRGRCGLLHGVGVFGEGWGVGIQNKAGEPWRLVNAQTLLSRGVVSWGRCRDQVGSPATSAFRDNSLGGPRSLAGPPTALVPIPRGIRPSPSAQGSPLARGEPSAAKGPGLPVRNVGPVVAQDRLKGCHMGSHLQVRGSPGRGLEDEVEGPSVELHRWGRRVPTSKQFVDDSVARGETGRSSGGCRGEAPVRCGLQRGTQQRVLDRPSVRVAIVPLARVVCVERDDPVKLRRLQLGLDDSHLALGRAAPEFAVQVLACSSFPAFPFRPRSD